MLYKLKFQLKSILSLTFCFEFNEIQANVLNKWQLVSLATAEWGWKTAATCSSSYWIQLNITRVKTRCWLNCCRASEAAVLKTRPLMGDLPSPREAKSLSMISPSFDRPVGMLGNPGKILSYHSCLDSVSMMGSSGLVFYIPSWAGAAVKPSMVSAACVCVYVRAHSAVGASTSAKPQRPITRWDLRGKKTGPCPNHRVALRATHRPLGLLQVPANSAVCFLMQLLLRGFVI